MSDKKQKAPCTHCGKLTARHHPILELPLCQPCQSGRPDEYQYITKTRALDEYRLKPADLDRLRAHQVDNPHYKIASPMQLYLRSQIANVSHAKWGRREPYIVALREFSEEFLASLNEDPQRIQSLTPEKFQYLIADRLEQWGLEVQLVGKINRKDGGIDLIAYPRSGPPFLLAVQAKHHRRGGPTRVESIRDLHGALTSTHSPFHMGMLVTNTRFTPDATWFGEQNRKLLRLRDLDHLRRWFRGDFSNEAEWHEIPSKVKLAPGVEITISQQTLIVPPPRRLISVT
jgi:hypothetical protein